MKQSGLTAVPMTLKAANAFVSAQHRHHGPLPGGLDYFRVGAIDEAGHLRGVAIACRPSNRNSDDGLTCEVARVATDGVPNGCSFLYGAVARIARAMGFARVITYTLDSEGGASLLAAGWLKEADGIRSWWRSHQVPGRTVKARAHYIETKSRWAAWTPLFSDNDDLRDQEGEMLRKARKRDYELHEPASK